jgi:hypothetical protein
MRRIISSMGASSAAGPLAASLTATIPARPQQRQVCRNGKKTTAPSGTADRGLAKNTGAASRLKILATSPAKKAGSLPPQTLRTIPPLFVDRLNTISAITFKFFILHQLWQNQIPLTWP